MPSFEEEAFERARKMSHNRRQNSAPHREEPPAKEPTKPAPSEKTEKSEKSEKFEKFEKPKPAPIKPPAAPNMLETLFQNRENSLILMLLLLLMDEKNDPSLIFSLMYLLL